MPSIWPFLGNDVFGETARSLLMAQSWPAASLLTGPVGLGKALMAVWVVQADLCQTGTPGTPCGTCTSCRQIKERAHPDVVVLDGADGSIAIATIREAIQRFSLRSDRHRWLVCLDADQLTEGASNALLKTLEEPNPSVHILLTSSRPGKIPRTIISRCSVFRLHRVPLQDIPTAQRGVAVRTAGRPGLMESMTADQLSQDYRLARDFIKALDGQSVPIKKDAELEEAMHVEEEIIQDLMWRKAGQRTSAWSEFDEDLDRLSDKISFEQLFSLADQFAERRAFLGAHVSLRNVYEDIHHF